MVIVLYAPILMTFLLDENWFDLLLKCPQSSAPDELECAPSVL